MKGFELKTKQQIEDFVRGCCFYGVGGGGSYESGVSALTKCLENGKPIKVRAYDDIKDDDYFGSVWLMGSTAPRTPEMEEKMKKCGVGEAIYNNDEMLSESLKVMEEFTGKKIKALFAIELGGANTCCPMAVAFDNGLEFYDGDADGRAVPEFPQCLPALLDKPILPIAIVNQYGDTNILTRCINFAMMERNGKMLSDSGFGFVAHAACVMSGKDVKECLVPGTLTECLNVGVAIREARENGTCPVSAAIKASNGYFLGCGVVEKKEGGTVDGLYYGETYIKGIDSCAGNDYKVWFENENHIVWKNGEKWVTSPDLIEIVNMDTGEPITNTNLKAGDRVSIVAVSAREPFRSGKGLEVLSPRYFGFDYDWVPVEDVVDR